MKNVATITYLWSSISNLWEKTVNWTNENLPAVQHQQPVERNEGLEATNVPLVQAYEVEKERNEQEGVRVEQQPCS